MAGQQFHQRLTAPRREPLRRDLRAHEPHVLTRGPGRGRLVHGGGAPRDVRLEEVEVEGALAVDLQSSGSAWLRPSGASMPHRWTRAP